MMSSTDKVRSYLHNRKGAPVTNEQIAIGTKLKLGTVGPIVARLIDAGEVVRFRTLAKNRAGFAMSTVALAEYCRPETTADVVPRRKPMPRRWMQDCADALEAAANKVLTTLDDPDGPAHAEALNLLRIVRDGWRAAKNQYLPESERVVVAIGEKVSP